MRIKFFLISLILSLLIACSPSHRGENEIYIGTISGPETRLMEVAKKIAKERYGLDLKIITFEDYVMPNTALAEGDIDANMFQHQPYLDVILARKHYPLSVIGKMYIYPMGIYSKKYHSLEALPQGAIIGIPNDPSNGARALRLLAKAGLIEIPDADDLTLSYKDILTNSRDLRIREIPAAQLARALPDLDAAIINTNYAIPARLYPNKDALYSEHKDSPYVNVVVVRTDEKDEKKYEELMLALHSPEVQAAAEHIFAFQAIPGWE